MIILGLFDKINNSYDKFFMIRKDEFNNFMKSLKIIVNNGTDVLSVYSNDYYIVDLIHLSDTGIIFTGNIKNLSTDKYSLVIKLFNANGDSIGEASNDFSTEDKFDVNFDYNDSIKKEDIKKYSISIKR